MKQAVLLGGSSCAVVLFINGASPASSTPARRAEEDCPAGAYCETGEDATPCPVGTYNPNTGASSVDACLECRAGTVCFPAGRAQETECSVGSWCPAAGGGGAENPCPAGHYCKTPSMITLCPAGTSAVKGSSTADACLPYDFGSSCAAAVDLASIGSPYSGTTVGQPNDVSPSCYTSDSDAGEQMFFLDVPQGKIPLHY